MEVEQNNNALVKVSPSDVNVSLLTLRMIMQGKEVGSIIGKKGDNVRRFREESGARINISDASCPERIVTITGTTDQIVSAYTMICKRLEEDLQNSTPGGTTNRQLITLRLIIPANQCGSLIGKGGAKIKEIRDVAGASIQISSEMLPNSTERTVTVSGSVEAVTRGIYHICSVMLESPPKGTTIPYRPKIAMTPVILAGGQAYTMNGQYFMPQPDLGSGHPTILQYQPVPQFAKMVMQQGMMGHALSPYSPQQAILAPSYQCGFVRAPSAQGLIQHTNQTHEISIPNDLIGCIIGRGGSKINEIRQASGANIKIAGAEEGSSMRMVTISGPPEAINAAQYLINASLEMPKNMALTLDLNSYSSGSLASASSLSDLNPPLSPMNETSSPLTSANCVNFQSVELNPVINSAMAAMPAMPPFAFNPAKSLPTMAMNSRSPAATMAFTLVRAPEMPSTSLTPVGSSPASSVTLPHPSSLQFNPLTLNPSSPTSHFTIPFNPLVKPMILRYGTSFVGTTYFDPHRNVATKIRGGFGLTSVNKIGHKYAPY